MIGTETKNLSNAPPASHARGRTGPLGTARPHNIRPTTVPNTPSCKDRKSHGHRLQATAPTFVDASVVLAATRAAVPVRVKVPYLHLEFGEQLKVVGENAALGNWYSNAAPFLSWTEGDTWIHHSQLPPGTHYFKLVIVRDGGSLYWEEGENRSFEVPDSDVNGVLEVACEFGNTGSTDVSVVDASVLTERADTLGVESSSEIGENSGEALTAAAEVATEGSRAETEAASPSPSLPPPEAVEEVEALAAASPEESMFVEEVVSETTSRENVTSEPQGVAAEEPQTAKEDDVPAVEQLVAAIAEPLAAVEEQPAITASVPGAKAEEPELSTFNTEIPGAAQAEEPAAVKSQVPGALKAEEPAAVKAEETLAINAEEPATVEAQEHAAEEADKPEVQPVSHRPLSYTSNGSGFRTFGKATAAVLGEGSVVVTFSDDDEEDMAALTERLLAPKLTRHRGRQ